VIGDRKVGGILGEVVGDAAGDPVAILGLGLNVNWDRAMPPPPGIALDEVVGGPVDRSALLVALLSEVDTVLANVDPHRLLDAYRARSATLGRQVRVDLVAASVRGEAVDITPDGHLVVQTAGGTRRVVAAGDVMHLRGAGG
jgi:BirA family biotin operon repressor/biotin-[acetyl-CoA-carboxylase] ligase